MTDESYRTQLDRIERMLVLTAQQTAQNTATMLAISKVQISVMQAVAANTQSISELAQLLKCQLNNISISIDPKYLDRNS